MKKKLMFIILVFSFSFLIWGCSCNKGTPQPEIKYNNITFELISYEGCDDFIIIEDEVVEGKDYSFKFPANEFEKEGYYFISWKFNKESYLPNEERKIYLADIEKEKPFLIYAEWCLIEYLDNFALLPSIDKDFYGLVGYTGDKELLTSLTIPSYYNQVPITYIDDLVFDGFKNLENIQFSTVLIEIKQAAFRGCENLIHLVIPNNVEKIGNYAFHNCFNLESAILPEDLVIIPQGLFMCCHKLSGFTFPVNVQDIGDSSFRECHQLINVIVPNKVLKIRNNAFFNCENLQTITLSSSLLRLEGGVFMKCYKLNFIQLPSRLTHIENYTFKDCICLNYIKIPNSLIVMGLKVFDGCNSLTNIDINSTWEIDWLGDCQATLNN